MGILYALTASLLQGIGYTLLKKSFKEVAPSVFFMFETLFGLIIWVSYTLFVGADFSNFYVIFFFALLSALLSEAFVFYVFSKGEISITGTISSIYPIFTIFFSRLFLGESIVHTLVIFIILVIAGIILLSLPSEFTKEELKSKMYILWPLAGAIAVGISDTLSKGVLDTTSSSTFLLCLALAQVPISLVYLLFEKQLPKAKEVLFSTPKYRYTLFSAILISGSMVFFWLAFESTLASIASPLTAIQMLFVLLFSYLFMNEKLRTVEVVGILVVVAGVIGVGVVG